MFFIMKAITTKKWERHMQRDALPGRSERPIYEKKIFTLQVANLM